MRKTRNRKQEAAEATGASRSSVENVPGADKRIQKLREFEPTTQQKMWSNETRKIEEGTKKSPKGIISGANCEYYLHFQNPGRLQ